MDEPDDETIDIHQNMNIREDYVPLKEQREALIKYMTKVINYVDENISVNFKKGRAKISIAKKVTEVVDFLIAVKQVSNKIKLMKK